MPQNSECVEEQIRSITSVQCGGPASAGFRFGLFAEKPWHQVSDFQDMESCRKTLQDIDFYKLLCEDLKNYAGNFSATSAADHKSL